MVICEIELTNRTKRLAIKHIHFIAAVSKWFTYMNLSNVRVIFSNKKKGYILPS